MPRPLTVSIAGSFRHLHAVRLSSRAVLAPGAPPGGRRAALLAAVDALSTKFPL